MTVAARAAVLIVTECVKKVPGLTSFTNAARVHAVHERGQERRFLSSSPPPAPPTHTFFRDACSRRQRTQPTAVRRNSRRPHTHGHTDAHTQTHTKKMQVLRFAPTRSSNRSSPCLMICTALVHALVTTTTGGDYTFSVNERARSIKVPRTQRAERIETTKKKSKKQNADLVNTNTRRSTCMI